MVIFNSDLDNTLIFSYRRQVTGEKLCVEMMGDKELSFMTRHSYELLQQVRQRLCFVPTTTRTEEQYKRIHLGGEEPEYALVCNGGILLVNGIRDQSWYQESLSLVSDVYSEMVLAKKLLLEDKNRCFEIREIDGLFLFTKSSSPEESAKHLEAYLNTDKVTVFVSRSKLYVFSKQLSKGEALGRLKKRLHGSYVIAAGDGILDIPMLEAADRSILPWDLAEGMQKKLHMSVCSREEHFSDAMLALVMRETEKIR